MTLAFDNRICKQPLRPLTAQDDPHRQPPEREQPDDPQKQPPERERPDNPSQQPPEREPQEDPRRQPPGLAVTHASRHAGSE
jgi:hypothetical protein